MIGHLRETVTVRQLDKSEIVDRLQPPAGADPKDVRTYRYDGITPAPMPPFGSEYLSRTTGSTHDEKGEFCPTAQNIARVTQYLSRKIEDNRDDITITRGYRLEDAEIVLIAYGCSARSAIGAMELLREQGIRAGMLQLVTVWPLPEKEIREVLSKVKTVVVPEMNLGQIAGEIRKLNDYGCKVIQANRVDGILITPKEIIAALQEGK